jgi:hypothetical protein
VELALPAMTSDIALRPEELITDGLMG